MASGQRRLSFALFLIIYVQHFSVILEQSLNFLLAHNVVVVIFEPLTIFNCDFLTQLYRTISLSLVPTKKNTKICYFLLTNTCSKHTHPNIMGVYIPPPNDKDDGDKRNRIPTPTPTNQPSSSSPSGSTTIYIPNPASLIPRNPKVGLIWGPLTPASDNLPALYSMIGLQFVIGCGFSNTPEPYLDFDQLVGSNNNLMLTWLQNWYVLVPFGKLP